MLRLTPPRHERQPLHMVMGLSRSNLRVALGESRVMCGGSWMLPEHRAQIWRLQILQSLARESRLNLVIRHAAHTLPRFKLSCCSRWWVGAEGERHARVRKVR